MSSFKQVSFTVPTQNVDGTAITEALSYSVQIDTVNPPVKSYPVPATVTPVNGVLTVTFAQLGFTPVDGTQYYVAATASDASGSSSESSDVAFTNTSVPKAPTSLVLG